MNLPKWRVESYSIKEMVEDLKKRLEQESGYQVVGPVRCALFVTIPYERHVLHTTSV